ncbi:MAG: hypothetical protein ABI970_14670 [Chloroflexota bacterium]
MKLPNKLPPASRTDKRLLAASVIILLASAVIAVFAIRSRMAPSQPTYVSDFNGDKIEQPQGTLVPGVAGSSDLINQMTAIANSEPLTGPLADEVQAVAQMVTNCPDYSQARRDQMNYHIGWLLQPNTLPKQMLIALGNNVNGRLILGMSTFTLEQWGEKQKAANSCLLPIGKKLNDMLAANGEERIKQFDGT